VHHITVRDLPQPDPSDLTNNGPTMIPRPAGAWPKAPPGFKVELFATGLRNPRLMRAAPNGDNNPAEKDGADILAFTPEGKNKRVYAWGIRNAVGIVVNPVTGQLWASVNERDRLGDDLVPDYISQRSRVQRAK
jgi:glucose/arabinose dehydrogenase